MSNEENKIELYVTEKDRLSEFITISKEGFFFKGEKIDDIHNVYERFNDWLTLAEREKNESRKDYS